MSALWPFRASRLATFALTFRASSGVRPLISVQAHHLQADASKDAQREEKAKEKIDFSLSAERVERRVQQLHHGDLSLTHPVTAKLFTPSAFSLKEGGETQQTLR